VSVSSKAPKQSHWTSSTIARSSSETSLTILDGGTTRKCSCRRMRSYVPYEPTPKQAAWIARFPYATIVGKIVYLTAITRPPDIACAVSMLSRFLHYLSRTANYGLIYHGDELDMQTATCPVTRRSISGTVVFMCGAPVSSWMSASTDRCHILYGGRVHRRLL
jgi:hypothetical protein